MTNSFNEGMFKILKTRNIDATSKNLVMNRIMYNMMNFSGLLRFSSSSHKLTVIKKVIDMTLGK